MIMRIGLRTGMLAGVAATCGLVLVSACGAQDAPSCSSAKTETLVAQAIASSKSTNPMRWGLPFRQAGKTLALAVAEIDLPAFAKSMGFKFANERERGYDHEAKKRSCTAEVSASWDGTDSASLVSVQPLARSFTSSQENPILAAYLQLARENLFNAVEFDLTREPIADELDKGTPFTPDVTTASMLKAAFAGAMPKYLDQVRWAKPLDYTVQVTDKGGLVVTLNE